MERFKLAVTTGEPVNPPIWWIAPEDKIAQAIDDEFMLGDTILVAPVVQQGKVQGCMSMEKSSLNVFLCRKSYARRLPAERQLARWELGRNLPDVDRPLASQLSGSTGHFAFLY